MTFMHRLEASTDAADAPCRTLAAWQSARLEHTYADLRHSERYAPATEFFLADLYGPRDFSQRDRDAERVVHKMRRLLPERAMEAIESALHLNALTKALDADTADMLFGQMRVDHIDALNYAEAYRRCNYRERRLEQISLLDELGRELDVVVQKPMVQLALRVARGPAHMAGFGELQDFLERGVHAFLRMQGADEFLDIVVNRERHILDAIYLGEDDPFSIG